MSGLGAAVVFGGGRPGQAVPVVLPPKGTTSPQALSQQEAQLRAELEQARQREIAALEVQKRATEVYEALSRAKQAAIGPSLIDIAPLSAPSAVAAIQAKIDALRMPAIRGPQVTGTTYIPGSGKPSGFPSAADELAYFQQSLSPGASAPVTAAAGAGTAPGTTPPVSAFAKSFSGGSVAPPPGALSAPDPFAWMKNLFQQQPAFDPWGQQQKEIAQWEKAQQEWENRRRQAAQQGQPFAEAPPAVPPSVQKAQAVLRLPVGTAQTAGLQSPAGQAAARAAAAAAGVALPPGQVNAKYGDRYKVGGQWYGTGVISQQTLDPFGAMSDPFGALEKMAQFAAGRIATRMEAGLDPMTGTRRPTVARTFEASAYAQPSGFELAPGVDRAALQGQLGQARVRVNLLLNQLQQYAQYLTPGENQTVMAEVKALQKFIGEATRFLQTGSAALPWGGGWGGGTQAVRVMG